MVLYLFQTQIFITKKQIILAFFKGSMLLKYFLKIYGDEGNIWNGYNIWSSDWMKETFNIRIPGFVISIE